MAEIEEKDGMEVVKDGVPRPVRVVFPVLVSFSGEAFEIQEFTANLSLGGIFLPTERQIPVGTRGSLTFQISRWEPPFTIEAEVVRSSAPEEAGGKQLPGVGIKFGSLEPTHRRRLARLVEGICDGSVSEAIRRTVREGDITLGQELRKRTTDQKVMFAQSAHGLEIDALIRDGNPVVIQRLLRNQHLTIANVRSILKDTSLTAQVLAVLNNLPRFMAHEEIRGLYCAHPGLPVEKALAILPQLSRKTLESLVSRSDLRPPLLAQIRHLLRAPAVPGRG